MKKPFVIELLLLLFTAGSLFAYDVSFDVNIYNREVQVLARYRFAETSVKIDLPAKARLLTVASPNATNVTFTRNVNAGNNAVYIDKVQSVYKGSIDVLYALSVTGSDFVLSDWLPNLPLTMTCSAHFPVMTGYEAFPFPYRSQTSAGFLINPGDKPVIVFGKYSHQSLSQNGRNYAIYYPVQLNTPLNQAATIFEKLESLLTRLPQTNIVFVTLPTENKRTVFLNDHLFVVFNRGFADEVRKTLANVWFGGALKLPEDYAFAFSDLYARLLDDTGSLQTNDIYRIPVPSRSYYEGVIRSGIVSGQTIRCDVDSMLKNFALLHFAYYLSDTRYFMKRMQDFTAAGAHIEKLAEFIAPPGLSESYSKFVLGNLLPVAQYIPDLSVETGVVYRNNDLIPDVPLSVDNAWKETSWGQSRRFDIAGNPRAVQADPQRFVPQLNFYNDRFDSVATLQSQKNLALQAIYAHKHYAGESLREILDLEMFIVPAQNGFDLPAGSFVYTAVVKILAPIDGQLKTALKEIIISIADNKAIVIQDRIRI